MPKFAAGVASDWEDRGPATGSTGWPLGSWGIWRVLDVLDAWFSRVLFQVPSGELTFCHGKSPFLMGKSTISMTMFNCYVSSPEGKGSKGKERLWMIVRGLRLVRNGANCNKYIDGKGVAQCCPLQTKCLQDRSEEEDEGSSDGDEPRWSNDRHWTGSRGAAGDMLCTCYNLLMASRCYFQWCLNCYFQFLLSKIIQLMHWSWPSRNHDVNGCHDDTRAAPGCVVAGWKEKARARERALAPLKAKLSRPPPWDRIQCYILEDQNGAQGVLYLPHLATNYSPCWNDGNTHIYIYIFCLRLDCVCGCFRTSD